MRKEYSRRSVLGIGATVAVGGCLGDDDETPTPSNDDQPWGSSVRANRGVLITLDNPRVFDSYEYDTEGGGVHNSPEGEQFATVDITVENDTDEVIRSPHRDRFDVIAGQTQYDHLSYFDYEFDAYEGLNELAPGVAERGVQPVLIPGGHAANELRAIYATPYEAAVWG